MAYAALVSLSQSLEQVLDPDQYRILHKEQQIMRTLPEKVSFLLSSLEDYAPTNSETIICLEGRIRDAAYKAPGIIETNRYYQMRFMFGFIRCFWEIISVFH